MEIDWTKPCNCSDCREQRREQSMSKKQRRKARIAELEAEVEAQKAKQAELVRTRTAEDEQRGAKLDALARAGFVFNGESEQDRVRAFRHGLLPIRSVERNSMTFVRDYRSPLTAKVEIVLTPGEAAALQNWINGARFTRVSTASLPPLVP